MLIFRDWIKISVLSIFLMGIFASFYARASDKVSLYSLDRGPREAAIIIPVPEGMTPAQVWREYLLKLKNTPSLSSFYEDTRSVSFTPENFQIKKYNPETSSVILANTSQDLLLRQSRPENWTKLMSERGIKNHVIPLAMASVLTSAQRVSFYQEISDHFSMLFPLGGADVDPHIYGEEPNGARSYNRDIDVYESEIIKAYHQAEKGFIYATCRGSQMTAATLGYKLIQDIPSQLSQVIDHSDSEHDVLLDTKNDFVARIWPGLSSIKIYSYHHQAIVYKTEGPLLLAGVSPDGVSEILAFKNHRGVLIQGHPELTLGGKKMSGDFAAAKSLFDGFVRQAQKSFRFSCSKILL